MIQFYKPNKANTGNAFGFRMGTKNKEDDEPCVYMTAVQQHSWNSAKRSGSFAENAKDPEKSILVKFNEIELGGFIHAITNYEEFKAYHEYEDNSTSIVLKPYKKQNGTKAFSFTVTRNSTQKFGMGVELSEATLLCEYFKYVLQKYFGFKISKFKNTNR